MPQRRIMNNRKRLQSTCCTNGIQVRQASANGVRFQFDVEAAAVEAAEGIEVFDEVDRERFWESGRSEVELFLARLNLGNTRSWCMVEGAASAG